MTAATDRDAGTDRDTARPGVARSAGSRLATRTVVLAIATAVVAVVLIGATRLDYVGDELYFLSAGARPSWGYADQPPLVPLLAHLMDLLLPGSPLGLRLPAALAAGAEVVVGAALAHELGGSRRARIATAATVAVCPDLLGIGQQLATATFDPLVWSVLLWVLARWCRQHRDGVADDRLLLAIAPVAAIGLAVKVLLPVLAVGVLVGVALCGPRRLLTRPALAVAVALAAASSVPYWLWQAHHGWPQLGMGAVTSSEADLFGDRWWFLPTALGDAGIVPGIPVLLAGCWALARHPSMRPWRWTVVAAVVVVVAFLVAGGRPYYVIGLYPVLFAAGCVHLGDHVAARGRGRWRADLLVRPVVLGLGALLAVVVAVPPWTFVAGDRRVAVEHGWAALADDVAARAAALPADRRRGLVVITSYYWQAAALDRLGPPRGAPPVFSASRGFGFFEVPPGSGPALLVGDVHDAASACRALRPLPPHLDATAHPLVNGRLSMTWCEPRAPWSTLWPGMRTMVWPVAPGQLRR